MVLLIKKVSIEIFLSPRNFLRGYVNHFSLISYLKVTIQKNSALRNLLLEISVPDASIFFYSNINAWKGYLATEFNLSLRIWKKETDIFSVRLGAY